MASNIGNLVVGNDVGKNGGESSNHDFSEDFKGEVYEANRPEVSKGLWVRNFGDKSNQNGCRRFKELA